MYVCRPPSRTDAGGGGGTAPRMQAQQMTWCEKAGWLKHRWWWARIDRLVDLVPQAPECLLQAVTGAKRQPFEPRANSCGPYHCSVTSLANKGYTYAGNIVPTLALMSPQDVCQGPATADLHVASSLPHHPHGGPLDSITAQSTQHKRCLLAGAGICCYCLNLCCCYRPHSNARGLCSTLGSLRNNSTHPIEIKHQGNITAARHVSAVMVFRA